MKAVELFAGIGGFRVACDSLGLRTVWANDNAPQAVAVYRSRFLGAALHEGNLERLLDSIPPHDVLTGGFPCQPFSAAGKKRGIEDPRGTLFQLIVDVVREKKPHVFVLENVKRLLTMDAGKHFATILDALAGLDYAIEWRLLNAMNLGLPQNRQRVLIVGVRGGREAGGLRVRLARKSELAEADGYRHALLCASSSWMDITAHGAKFPSWGVALGGRFYGADLDRFADSVPLVPLKDVLLAPAKVGPEFDFTDSTIERLKSSASVQKFIGGVEILSNQGGGARMGYTVFGVNGVAPTLTCAQSRHYERYKIGDRYRRLTNTEYARIQGFDDEHCSVVSPFAQYALFGNAIPPPMARWALQRALSEGELLTRAEPLNRQAELFSHA